MNIQREHIVLRAIEPKDKEMLLEIINDAGTEYLLGGWALEKLKKNKQKSVTTNKKKYKIKKKKKM